jgi:hypothetical protein
LGTGVFLLARRTQGMDGWQARVWLTFLFLPIVPLRSVRCEGAPWEAADPASEFVLAPFEQGLGDVWKTYAGALGLGLLALAPLGYAWQTIHETGLLQAFKVVVGASVPILVLMWRDLRTPRLLR